MVSGISIILLLHGCFLGWLFVHHQHHPHLCFVHSHHPQTVRGLKIQENNYSIQHILHPWHSFGNANPVCPILGPHFFRTYGFAWSFYNSPILSAQPIHKNLHRSRKTSSPIQIRHHRLIDCPWSRLHSSTPLRSNQMVRAIHDSSRSHIC